MFKLLIICPVSKLKTLPISSGGTSINGSGLLSMSAADNGIFSPSIVEWAQNYPKVPSPKTLFLWNGFP